MELVDDNGLQAFEHERRIGIAQQQAQRFRRGQQHLRRLSPLALAFGRRRVAGACFHGDSQAHIGNGLHQIAMDVDGQGLQWRDVEGVQTLLRIFRQIHEAGKKPGQGLSAAGGGYEQRGPIGAIELEKLELMIVGLPAAPGEPGSEHRGKAGQGHDAIPAGGANRDAFSVRGRAAEPIPAPCARPLSSVAVVHGTRSDWAMPHRR